MLTNREYFFLVLGHVVQEELDIHLAAGKIDAGTSSINFAYALYTTCFKMALICLYNNNYICNLTQDVLKSTLHILETISMKYLTWMQLQKSFVKKHVNEILNANGGL